MMATELVQKLNELISQHGDKPMRVLDTDHEYFDPVFSCEHRYMYNFENNENTEYFVLNYE